MSSYFYDPDLIEDLYNEKRYEELSQEFIHKIQRFRNYNGNFITIISELNNFFYNFLKIFTRENFVIPVNHYIYYINLNPLISDLVFISEIETTDRYVDILMDGKTENLNFNSINQFVKILTLYSLRNKTNLPYEDFFSFNKNLSSSWYWIYFHITDFSGKINFKNIVKHIDNIERINYNLNCDRDILQASLISTYGNPEKDIIIKRKMNLFIQDKYRTIQFYLKPDPKKIAIVSGLLSPVHSVYRCTFPFIKSLTDDYELTLIHVGELRDDTDTEIFKNVINLKLENYNFDFSKLRNDYSLVFYPDIGFIKESVFLSNIRIAPVQVSGHGHSVGSYGSKIDYFISGQLSEVEENAEKYYSERLVLIPGIGLHPSYPNYILKTLYSNESLGFTSKPSFIITCPWSLQKINYNNLVNLKEIISKSEKKLLFRFFPGILNYSILEAFKKQVYSILGEENVDIVRGVDYTNYMKMFEECDMAIDSYHFGGYNTIIDSLYLRKPVITLEGKRAYNRFASGILKNLDLKELITYNNEEYISKIVRMINDDSYRSEIIKKLSCIDLQEKLFENNEPKYFKKAIDFLIKNHHELKNLPPGKPIIIK